MKPPTELETLYQQAQSALRAREYNRASKLLKQILIVNENYKDASRMLARIVKIGRRRWYNDLRIWGPAIGFIVIGLLIWLVPKISLPARLAPTPTSTITASPTVTVTPANTAIPTITPSPAPTPIPLAWKRISMGQDFSRDQVTAIIFNPKDPDVIYIGLQSAGMYKSIDGGSSWQPAHNGLASTLVSSLVISPDNPDTLYAGTEAGVFVTHDGGEQWSFSLKNFSSEQTLLLMDPEDNKHIYFASLGDGRIFETRDGGLFWRQKQSESRFASIAIDPRDAQTLWAVDESGMALYRSTDSGTTWSLILSNEPSEPWQTYDEVVASDRNGGTIWLFGGGFVLASSDNGATWEYHNLLQTVRCQTILPDPVDLDTIYCGVPGNFANSTRLLRTEDGGQTWGNVTFLSLEGVSAMAISPADNQVILVGGDGLLYSTDGGKMLEERNNGLGGRQIELAINPVDPAILYASEGPCYWGESQHYPLYRSEDRSTTWSVLQYASEYQACGLTIDANGNDLYRYASSGGNGNRLMVSRTRGETWLSLFPSYSHVWGGIAAHPYQTGRIFAGGMDSDSGSPALFHSSDGGIFWTSDPLQTEGRWWRIHFAADQGQTIYLVQDGMPAYRSVDGGNSFTPCQNYYDFSISRPGEYLAIDPRDGNHLVMGTRGRGIYISNSGCELLKRIYQAGLNINALKFDPVLPDTVYAGTDSGAYVSFDGGETWGQVNDGLLGATVVYSIVVDQDSNVYAATPYGIFKLENR